MKLTDPILISHLYQVEPLLLSIWNISSSVYFSCRCHPAIIQLNYHRIQYVGCGIDHSIQFIITILPHHFPHYFEISKHHDRRSIGIEMLFTSSLPDSSDLHGIHIVVPPSLLHKRIADEDELLLSLGTVIGISALSNLLAKSLKNNRAFTAATADSVKLFGNLLGCLYGRGVYINILTERRTTRLWSKMK